MRKARNKPFVPAPRPSVGPQIAQERCLPLTLATPRNPETVQARVAYRTDFSERGITGRLRC